MYAGDQTVSTHKNGGWETAHTHLTTQLNLAIRECGPGDLVIFQEARGQSSLLRSHTQDPKILSIVSLVDSTKNRNFLLTWTACFSVEIKEQPFSFEISQAIAFFSISSGRQVKLR